MNKRFAAIILGAIVFAGLLTVGHSQTAHTTPDWHKRISSHTKNLLTFWLSPCGSPVHVLKIDGKRFENVRGKKKFYLTVPKTNAIVFVVDEKDYSITYHYYNMDAKEDVVIHTSDISLFGQAIGTSHPEYREDTVAVAENGRIVLCTIEPDSKTAEKSFVYLDVNKKEIASE